MRSLKAGLVIELEATDLHHLTEATELNHLTVSQMPTAQAETIHIRSDLPLFCSGQ